LKIEELETVLSKYKMHTYKASCYGEKVSLPSMLTIFRELIINNIPPTQEEFIKCFKEKHPALKMGWLPARLSRAYLSYVREYHLGYLLRRHFKNVVYDEAADIAGVDYIIKYKHKTYNIHAYVNTKNGRYWRKVKDSRHVFTGNHLDLPLDLSQGKHCGEFILYTDGMVKNLKNRM